jgi:hypothetical protein
MSSFIAAGHSAAHLTCCVRSGDVFCVDCAAEVALSGAAELRQLGLLRSLHAVLQTDTARVRPALSRSLLPMITAGLDGSDTALVETAVDCLMCLRQELSAHLPQLLQELMQKLLTLSLPRAAPHLFAVGALLEVAREPSLRRRLAASCEPFVDAVVSHAPRGACQAEIVSTSLFVCLELVEMATEAGDCGSTSAESDSFVALLTMLPELLAVRSGDALQLNAVHYYAAACRYCFVRSAAPGWCRSAALPASEHAQQSDNSAMHRGQQQAPPQPIVALFQGERSRTLPWALKPLLLRGAPPVRAAAAKLVTFLASALPCLTEPLLAAGLGDFMADAVKTTVTAAGSSSSSSACSDSESLQPLLEALHCLASLRPLVYFAPASFAPDIMYPLLRAVLERCTAQPACCEVATKLLLLGLRFAPPGRDAGIVETLLHGCAAQASEDASASAAALSSAARVLAAVRSGGSVPRDAAAFWSSCSSVLSFLEEAALLHWSSDSDNSNNSSSSSSSNSRSELLSSALLLVEELARVLQTALRDESSGGKRTARFRPADAAAAAAGDAQRDAEVCALVDCIARLLEVYEKDVLAQQRLAMDSTAASRSNGGSSSSSGSGSSAEQLPVAFAACLGTMMDLCEQAFTAGSKHSTSAVGVAAMHGLAHAAARCTNNILRRVVAGDTVSWLLRLWAQKSQQQYAAPQHTTTTAASSSDAAQAAQATLQSVLLTVLHTCATGNGLVGTSSNTAGGVDAMDVAGEHSNSASTRDALASTLKVALRRWTGSALNRPFDTHIMDLLRRDDFDIGLASLALLLACVSPALGLLGSRSASCSADALTIMQHISAPGVALFSLSLLRISESSQQLQAAAAAMLARFPCVDLVRHQCFTAAAALQVLLLSVSSSAAGSSSSSSGGKVFTAWLKYAPLQSVCDVSAELLALPHHAVRAALAAAVLNVLLLSSSANGDHDSSTADSHKMAAVLLLEPAAFFDSSSSAVAGRYADALAAAVAYQCSHSSEGESASSDSSGSSDAAFTALQSLLRLACACVAARSDALSQCQREAEFDKLAAAAVTAADAAFAATTTAGCSAALGAANLLNLLAMSLGTAVAVDSSSSSCRGAAVHLQIAWSRAQAWWNAYDETASDERSPQAALLRSACYTTAGAGDDIATPAAVRAALLLLFGLGALQLSSSSSGSGGSGSTDVFCGCPSAAALKQALAQCFQGSSAAVAARHSANCISAAARHVPLRCLPELHLELLSYTAGCMGDDECAADAGFAAITVLWSISSSLAAQPWVPFVLQAVAVYYGEGRRPFSLPVLAFLELLLPLLPAVHAQRADCTAVVQGVAVAFLACRDSQAQLFSACARALAAAATSATTACAEATAGESAALWRAVAQHLRDVGAPRGGTTAGTGITAAGATAGLKLSDAAVVGRIDGVCTVATGAWYDLVLARTATDAAASGGERGISDDVMRVLLDAGSVRSMTAAEVANAAPARPAQIAV